MNRYGVICTYHPTADTSYQKLRATFTNKQVALRWAEDAIKRARIEQEQGNGVPTDFMVMKVTKEANERFKACHDEWTKESVFFFKDYATVVKKW